jgi:hypothetical protein
MHGNLIEFYYCVCRVSQRYLEKPKAFFDLAINFYYIINKLIILITDPH